MAFDVKLQDSRLSENPIMGVFGSLDLTFIVTVVLSLFALLLTYDTICGEKEQGTLRLILTNAVPRDKIISAKIVGGLISTYLPILFGLLLGLMALSMFPTIRLGNEEWLRLFLIVVNFLLYLLVFFSLGLFVSSRTTRSTVSFLMLLAVWVLLVIIVPRAAVVVAGQLYPIPSSHEVQAEKNAILQEVQGKALQERAEYMKANPFEGGGDQNREAWQKKLIEATEGLQERSLQKINERNAKVEASYVAKRRKQRQFAVALSRISPASLATYAAMNLADTGLEKVDKFLADGRAYKLAWTDYVNKKMFEALSNGQEAAMQKKPNLEDMPEFRFRSLSLEQSLALAQWDFAIMFMFAVLFFLATIFSFLNYDAT